MHRFAIDNATIWIGDGSFLTGHVVVRGGHIERVESGPYTGNGLVIDLEGMALSPGMIDLMVLGGFDRSILRDDPLEVAREYLRLGITACQLCIGTLPWSSMAEVVERTRRSRLYDGVDGAEILGLYLEGPFQHPERTGASLPEHVLPPSPENVMRILDDFGDVVTTINVSPGTPGAPAAVKTLCAAGKLVSMAHSAAPAEEVYACLEAGTSVLGHVWDNNSGLIGDSGVQQPTIEHVALIDPRIRSIHLICDGVHVHPVMIKLVLKCRGLESLCLVTDAIKRAGCADGPYRSDDGRQFYKEGGVGRTDKGGLCGSATLLPDMFRNFVTFTGISPHQAIRTVTHNPAKSLGLEKLIGMVGPGRMADLVAWDADLMKVRRVWRAGKEVKTIADFAEVEV